MLLQKLNDILQDEVERMDPEPNAEHTERKTSQCSLLLSVTKKLERSGDTEWVFPESSVLQEPPAYNEEIEAPLGTTSDDVMVGGTLYCVIQ